MLVKCWMVAFDGRQTENDASLAGQDRVGVVGESRVVGEVSEIE